MGRRWMRKFPRIVAGPCTHAVPCTLIFGNASTNRRLSTERHRVEVNKPPDG